MLPYVILAGLTNYAKWVPVYLTDNEFETGNFTVDRSERHFASVLMDMSLEQLVNCNSKSQTSLIGKKPMLDGGECSKSS